MLEKHMRHIYDYVKRQNEWRIGIRIGVRKMNRFGMKEQEMERIARLIRECIAQGKEVREQVNLFRENYTLVKYPFDELLKDLKSPNIFS